MGGKVERFIFTHEAGDEYEGAIVYRNTDDGAVTLYDGTIITDERILNKFYEIVIPY